MWLIEVNTNPALTTDCSRVTNAVIPNMINNAFMIAIDPFVRSGGRQADTVKYENLFTVIYDD